MALRRAPLDVVAGLAALAASTAPLFGDDPPKLITYQEVIAMSAPAPTARISYGDGPLQFAELRVPEGNGPHPIAIVIHGGCWLAAIADLKYTGSMSDALCKKGVATWNIEYRRADDEGGGFPGTFFDVGLAADHLRKIAKQHNLDLSRIIAVGHSAGGHLAAWLAARPGLDRKNPLYAPDPLPIHGIVGLAGVFDLVAFASDDPTTCGNGVVKLMGGKHSEVPDRYAAASPINLLPLRVRQVLLQGALDRPVPPRFARPYVDAARAKGDDVRYVELPDAGHFELVVPGSSAWPEVESAVLSILHVASPAAPTP